jgi:DNA-binding CsgD family transcriptional regulator
MHVRNVLAKLDCSTRTAAVSHAAELGLLEAPLPAGGNL